MHVLLQVRHIVQTVLPFNTMVFKDYRALPSGAAPGLSVLQGCAQVLMQNILLDSYLAGLDIRMEVGCDLLTSSLFACSLNHSVKGTITRALICLTHFPTSSLIHDSLTHRSLDLLACLLFQSPTHYSLACLPPDSSGLLAHSLADWPTHRAQSKQSACPA